MPIEENIRNLEQRITEACERAGRPRKEVTLIAVTKTINIATIEDAYSAGIHNFGENRIQEAEPKIDYFTTQNTNVTWHMIGHLQSNKAKTAANVFDIIHSIDSLKLAGILNDYASKKIPVLIQVNVAAETSKSGFPLEEINNALNQIARLPNLDIRGLMTIAPWVKDAETIRPVFRKLCQLRDALGVQHLSMGMSNDFEVAIEEGATFIRVGRAIFGKRAF